MEDTLVGGELGANALVEVAFVRVQAARAIGIAHQGIADRLGGDVRDVLHADLAAKLH